MPTSSSATSSKKKTRFRGLTLVELLVAGAISLILIIAVFLIFKKGMSGVNRGSEKLNHLHEANRLLAKLRDDLKLADGLVQPDGENGWTFMKRVVSTGSVTGPAKNRIYYTLEKDEGSPGKGKILVRTESPGPDSSLTNDMIRTFGRGMIQEFELTNVPAADPRFVKIKLVMVKPKKYGQPSGEEEASDQGPQPLTVNTLVMPLEKEGADIKQHWIENPKNHTP